MPIINWNNRYLTGLSEIDEHHQRLFFLINYLYDELYNNSSAEFLNSIFVSLIDYTGYHFSAEEILMNSSEYPNYELHKREHGIFSSRLFEMYRLFSHGRATISLELLTFLQNWLTTHIQLSDVEFGRYLSDRSRLEGRQRRAGCSTI